MSNFFSQLYETAADSVSEFAEGLNVNQALLDYSNQKIKDSLGNKPVESGLASAAPEKAVEQVYQPATTQEADKARVTNAMGDIKKYLPWAAVGLGVVALFALRGAR